MLGLMLALTEVAWWLLRRLAGGVVPACSTDLLDRDLTQEKAERKIDF